MSFVTKNCWILCVESYNFSQCRFFICFFSSEKPRGNARDTKNAYKSTGSPMFRMILRKKIKVSAPNKAYKNIRSNDFIWYSLKGEQNLSYGCCNRHTNFAILVKKYDLRIMGYSVLWFIRATVRKRYWFWQVIRIILTPSAQVYPFCVEILQLCNKGS